MMGGKLMSACIPRKMKTLIEALGCEGSTVFGSSNWNSNCGFAINLPRHLQQYLPESLSSSHYVLDNTVVLGTYWLMHVSCYHHCKRDFAKCEQHEMENSEWMFSLWLLKGKMSGKDSWIWAALASSSGGAAREDGHWKRNEEENAGPVGVEWGLAGNARWNWESLELRMQTSEVGTLQNVEGWVADEGK